MQCLSCQKELSGRQRKHCSLNCKNKYFFTSGKLVNFQKRMAYNRKLELVNMFGGSCQSCGYNKCLRVLSFHHNDRSQKSFCINQSALQSKKWEVILEESKKCSLLCSNCHIEFHSNEDKTYEFDETGLKEYEYNKKLHKPAPVNCKTCNILYYPKYNSSKYCSNKCRSINYRKIKRPSREVLLQQIQDLGFKATGRIYSVRDNTVRKWVTFYEKYPNN